MTELGKKGGKRGENKEKGFGIDDTRLRGHKLSIDYLIRSFDQKRGRD